jgi:tRNA 2-thiouridine synthesizing protein E
MVGRAARSAASFSSIPAGLPHPCRDLVTPACRPRSTRMSPEAVSSTLELNEEGFLAHPEGWTPDVATVLAREQEGIETLGDKHWAAINYIRAYYLEKGMAPMIRALCQNTGLRLREIYDLFPSRR